MDLSHPESPAPPHALVTGASAGIGAEVARILSARGWALTLTARSVDRLEALAGELDTGDAPVRVVPADLSRPEGVEALVQAVVQADTFSGTGATPGPVDLLVNNAGFGQWGPYPELDGDGERAMIEVNVLALTRLTRAVLPGMIERGAGRILNVGSVAGFFPGPFMTSYYATKAFVLSYSEALAVELEGTGVTVTCLCPGATRTGFQDRAGMRIPEGLGPGILTARTVAQAGIDGAMRGKSIVVPGLVNRVAVSLPRFLPRRWVTKMLEKIQGARRTTGGG
jgi:short-subunit dehydrogenase